ncbi:MAG: SRPBCC family protein [Myxococcota bacterium]
MKWLRYTALGLGILSMLFLIGGLMLPSAYRVERSIVVQADRAQIHQLVGDLDQWPQWTPWQETDPTVRTTVGDQSTGVGAHQSWVGKSGSGELTLTESSPQTGISYDMSFDGGAFQSTSSMRYEDAAEGVKVVWSLNGDNGYNILGRYFARMMDDMVGPYFEKGLAKLKNQAESVPKPTAEDDAETEQPTDEEDPEDLDK